MFPWVGNFGLWPFLYGLALVCFVEVHFPRGCFTSGTKMFGWQFTELCWADQKRKQSGGNSQCFESALLLHGLIESFQTSWRYQPSSGHAVVWRETPFPSFLSLSFQFWIPVGGGRASSCTTQPSSLASGPISLSCLSSVLESQPLISPGKSWTCGVLQELLPPLGAGDAWITRAHTRPCSQGCLLIRLLMLFKTSFFYNLNSNIKNWTVGDGGWGE